MAVAGANRRQYCTQQPIDTNGRRDLVEKSDAKILEVQMYFLSEAFKGRLPTADFVGTSAGECLRAAARIQARDHRLSIRRSPCTLR